MDLKKIKEIYFETVLYGRYDTLEHGKVEGGYLYGTSYDFSKIMVEKLSANGIIANLITIKCTNFEYTVVSYTLNEKDTFIADPTIDIYQKPCLDVEENLFYILSVMNDKCNYIIPINEFLQIFKNNNKSIVVMVGDVNDNIPIQPSGDKSPKIRVLE